jgi:hypothetical protein
MGPPASSSSDAASLHGQRAGTQPAGFGTEEYSGNNNPSTATQQAVRALISIYCTRRNSLMKV